MSEDLTVDFEDLEKDYEKVQKALIDFYWLTKVVKKKEDKVLHHQLDALYDLLEGEVKPIMEVLKVDAWVISKQNTIGSKQKWSVQKLNKVNTKFEEATIDFGFDLQWLLETLDMAKEEEGILKELKIHEDRFRESVKKLSKMYRGEWGNLFKNIRNRVHDIVAAAIKEDTKGTEME